jgi:3-hydroxyacyl-[acyl-carrier-protein] dehydratase
VAPSFPKTADQATERRSQTLLSSFPQIPTGAELIELLPQKHPFRFVDEVLSVDKDSIAGRYTFREDEVFYPGHFPGDPVTPGVILLEAMAQIGLALQGIYLLSLASSEFTRRSYRTLLTESSIQLEAIVRPGDCVTIHSSVITWRRKLLRCRAQAFNTQGSPVASAVIAGMVSAAENIPGGAH